MRTIIQKIRSSNTEGVRYFSPWLERAFGRMTEYLLPSGFLDNFLYAPLE